jgi:hypothetical protein
VLVDAAGGDSFFTSSPVHVVKKLHGLISNRCTTFYIINLWKKIPCEPAATSSVRPSMDCLRVAILSVGWIGACRPTHNAVLHSAPSAAWLGSVHISIFLSFRNDSAAIVYQTGDSSIPRRCSCDSNSS